MWVIKPCSEEIHFPDAPEVGRSIARLIVILRFASLSRDFFAFIPNQEQTHDR
jgi:hypothetical protein